ncbi:putative ras-related protein RSR1 [Rhodotorula diobovata]|uniref:Putative ras-related protein RSR1 n=1 Tax=Rhodotorula diobovata TaxID=5288 RepID=A0A5C5FMA3_9BASI|nr:putative ras-related protein RSR1 [Rhodotorula diobovata]
MGGGGVGKSALTVRFVHAMFVEKYDPTIEDSYRRNLTVDGITVALEVLDTAGTEQFMSLSTLYMRSGDGFLLVFSLTSVESISELHTIREQIMRIKEATLIPGKEQRVPIVLVGNKLDLTHERQVSREVAVHLSRSWGGVPYYETSARKEINVNAIFEDVVRQMIKADATGSSRRSSRNGGFVGSDRQRKRRCTLL